MLLLNKVAIITGGAVGIGRGIALKFAEEGCSVVVADVIEDTGKATADELVKMGREALFVKCDVSRQQEVESMTKRVMERFGQIDVLVNNAGICGVMKSITEVSEEEWDRFLGINLKGVFLCCKAVIGHMKKRRRGRIINISSKGAIAPPGPQIHYTASKAGILGMTLDLSLELAPYGIGVNAILPGGVLTQMIERLGEQAAAQTGMDKETCLARYAGSVPMGRLGTPGDVANAALFFASELSSYITGERLLVAGGSPLLAHFREDSAP